MNEHDLETTEGIIACMEELTGRSLKTEYDDLPVDVALIKMLETSGFAHGVWFDEATERIAVTLCVQQASGIHGYGQTFRDAAIGALSAYEQWRSNV